MLRVGYENDLLCSEWDIKPYLLTNEQFIKPFSGVVVIQEVAGLMGDANYWKHEAEMQAYKKLFWDTVRMPLTYFTSSAVTVFSCHSYVTSTRQHLS